MADDRIAIIRGNVDAAHSVEYRYWDDSEDATKDMLWLLGEVARFHDNYAIFEELAPPDLPRDSFARLCYRAFEEADAKNHRIEQLEKALRLAVSDAYRAIFTLTGMQPVGVRYGFVSINEWLALRVEELIADAMKARP